MPLRRHLLAAATVLATPLLQGAVYTVAPDGSGDYTEIQAAIDIANPGDRLEVSPGVYVGLIDFGGKSIEVVGIAGPGPTLLDGNCLGDTVDMTETGTGALLEGFTVTGACPPAGSSNSSYAIFAGASAATIRRVVIRDNNGRGIGSGAYPSPCPASPLVIQDSAFVNNFGSGARYVLDLGCSTVLETILIAGNQFNPGIQAWDTETLDASNIVISHPGRAFAIDSRTATGSIRNITVQYSAQPFTVGVMLRDRAPAPFISSSIISGPSDVVIGGEQGFEGALDNEYTNLWGQPGALLTYRVPDPTGTAGNISADPLFVAFSDDGIWGNDDLCLAPGSPGIDAGDPDPAFNDDDGSRNDMGAFGGPGAPSCEYMRDSDADGFAPIMGDCDDLNGTAYPFATEIVCDGIDQDCDGIDPVGDRDGDGFDGDACGGTDCDDEDPAIHPDATEEACDEIDQDCDGADLIPDEDGDGYGDAACGGVDCDDQAESVHPDALEICGDGIDNDCLDGDREGDLDEDGTYGPECGGEDCDDEDPERFPSAVDEFCDDIDQDCNGTDAEPPEGCGDDADDDGGLGDGGPGGCACTGSLSPPIVPSPWLLVALMGPGVLRRRRIHVER